MSQSEVPNGAGDALINAIRVGREQSERRARFQRWLGAYTIATHIVEALARRPGLRDVPSTVIRDAFQRIAHAGNRGYEQLRKRLERQGIALNDPAYQMQVKRLVFESVARHWPDDPEAIPDLFQSVPTRGDTLTEDFSTQIALVHGYLQEVVDQIEREGETPPGERAMAGDYALDRLLAAHSMYLRLHDGVLPFFNAHVAEAGAAWRRLAFGQWAAKPDLAVTDVVHHLVGEVILPIVDERHAHLIAVFDPVGRFSAADRHAAYRALITNVTGDAVSALGYQQPDLVNEIQGYYDNALDTDSTDLAGVVSRWLAGQINYRLDRVYPRPDEYIDGGGL